MKSRLAILLAAVAFAQAAGAAVFATPQIDPARYLTRCPLYHTRHLPDLRAAGGARRRVRSSRAGTRGHGRWAYVALQAAARREVHRRHALQRRRRGLAYCVPSIQIAAVPTYQAGAKKVDDLTWTSSPRSPPILPLSDQLADDVEEWCVEHRVEQPLDFKAKEGTYAARHTMGTAPSCEELGADQKTVLVANRLLGPPRQRDRGRLFHGRHSATRRGSSPASSTSWTRACRTSPQSMGASRWRPRKALAPAIGFDYAREAQSDVKGKNPSATFACAGDSLAITSGVQSKVMRGLARRQFVRPWSTAGTGSSRNRRIEAEGMRLSQDSPSISTAAPERRPTRCAKRSPEYSRVGIKVNFEPKTFNVLPPKLTSGHELLRGGLDAETAVVRASCTFAYADGVGDYNFGAFEPKLDELIDRE